MMTILEFFLARAKERSTWLGLISLATAAGLVLRPDVQEAVVTTGMALAGLILALTRDSVNKQ